MKTLDYEELREDVKLMEIVTFRDSVIGMLMDVEQFVNVPYQVIAEQLDNGTWKQQYKNSSNDLKTLTIIDGLNQKVKQLKDEYLTANDIDSNELDIIIRFMSER